MSLLRVPDDTRVYEMPQTLFSLFNEAPTLGAAGKLSQAVLGFFHDIPAATSALHPQFADPLRVWRVLLFFVIVCSQTETDKQTDRHRCRLTHMKRTDLFEPPGEGAQDAEIEDSLQFRG